MLKFYPGEEWKEWFTVTPLQFRYAISNFGRLISFTSSFEDGRFLKGTTSEGYKAISYKYRKEGKIKNKGHLIHNLVASNFLSKPSEEHCHVIHLNHERSNNHVDNLKYVTMKEKVKHNQTSPYVIAARARRPKTVEGHKLNATQVLLIKKRIFNPNRKTRLKLIAKQFGISEMQLHRIKTGENWGHIKIE